MHTYPMKNDYFVWKFNTFPMGGLGVVLGGLGAVLGGLEAVLGWSWGRTASFSGSARSVSCRSGCLGCLGRSGLKFDRCRRSWACFVELIRHFPFSAAQVWGRPRAPFSSIERVCACAGLAFQSFFPLGGSWGALGRSWGALGRSWPLCSAFLSALGRSWPQLCDFYRCFIDFWSVPGRPDP